MKTGTEQFPSVVAETIDRLCKYVPTVVTQNPCREPNRYRLTVNGETVLNYVTPDQIDLYCMGVIRGFQLGVANMQNQIQPICTFPTSNEEAKMHPPPK